MDQGLPPPPFSVPSMGVASGLESPTVPAAGLMQSVGLVPPGASRLSKVGPRTIVVPWLGGQLEAARPPRAQSDLRSRRAPH